jgi:hypothetical protein
MTPHGCDACVSMAGCGWCEQQGCTEGNETGPTAEVCDDWWFEACPMESGTVYIFTATAVLFGLTAAIGGGLAFGSVTVLVFFIRRMLLRHRAEKEFDKFLNEHRNSCSECEDIVASVRCLVCNHIFCTTCARIRNCGGAKERRKHKCVPLRVEPDAPVEQRHYESFALLRSRDDDNEMFL